MIAGDLFFSNTANHSISVNGVTSGIGKSLSILAGQSVSSGAGGAISRVGADPEWHGRDG